MALGLLMIGSIIGTLSAAITLIAGQPLSIAILVYFVSALLAVGAVIAVCAWKHAVGITASWLPTADFRP